MKTLTTIKAWILICSIIVVSRANADHSSSHHDQSHHGGSIPQNIPQNTIVPFGIQIPDHVLSTPDVACISADSNIFEIMNKAQETCNGTGMRCTFYHFVNHGYQNIGTLDIDKELFDDLLMKFDNWLLTAEDIETDDVPLEAKTKEDSVLDMTSINVNGSHSNEELIKKSTNVSETERLDTNHGVHLDKVDHNTNESDADKVVNTHNINNLYDTHHRNHHHKLKNGNHIKLVPEYNNEHRYFEVFLPKDQETGKSRTIYVEVDKEKNEFVLLDEEIDKKLNGTKPIRIEIDELSEIADTAFNNIAKSANHKERIKSNLYDDEINDLNKNSALHEDEIHLDIDVGDSAQNILNVCYPNICNINANQQVNPDNTTGLSKKIINVSKNLVVPNKYINQAQFYVESQIDNTTNVILNDHLELLESSNNETDIYQTGFNEETPLDTIEFNENNTNIDIGLDNIENSHENCDIFCVHNSTENYELSTENDNITFYDDSFINLEENNDTCIDINFNDTYDLSSTETIHLNEHLLHAEKPVQENNLKSTPNIYSEPELTSSVTAGISDYISSQLDAIPSKNQKAQMDHSLEHDVPLSPYTTVPLLGKDLAKVLETDGHLQSSFPVYATLHLPASASQNTPLNYDFEHPSVSSYNSPLDSNFGHESSKPKKIESTFPIFPSPPVECIVRLNKGSKYSPFNFGFSWLPSYSRVEELRLPCAVGPLQQEPILQVPVQKNKQLSDSICTVPTSPDHIIPIEDPRLCQTVPSLSIGIQKPYHLEVNAPMSPKNVLPSNLDSPKSSSDLDRTCTPYQLSEIPLSVMPISLKDLANSPCPMQPIPPYLQPTKPNEDLGFIKYSAFDNNSKNTMIPCAPNHNRYPYTTVSYFLNPYLKPTPFIPPYLEPILPVAPLQYSKIPTVDSLPLASDQSYPCLEEDYSKTNKPISVAPFALNSPFLPLNPLLLGPGFVPNTYNPWNNIPTLPCTMLTEQNLRNYLPNVDTHLTPGLQQNQILKPLLSNSVPLSVFKQHCPIKNNLEIKPPSCTSFLNPVKMDLNPSLALERDLQSLSLKYGIPLTKILNSLETEISDIHSKISSPTLEVPYSNFVHESSLKTKPNAAFEDDNRSDYEESLLEAELSDLVPLDPSLIGPHLEIESSLMLEANDSKSNTVVSDTTIPTLHSSFERQTNKLVHDSTLIGPHLPTLPLSHFDEKQNANEVVILESDYSNLKRLDSSLIGPHLQIGSPPIVLDSSNSQGDILTSHTEVPITISSQIEPKLNLNHPTHLVRDSFLIGSNLPSLSTVKVSDQIQNSNDMIPLGSDLTDLTPLDLSVIHTPEDLVNQLDQTEIFKHEYTVATLLQPAAVPSTKLPPKYLPKKLVEEKLLVQSDSLIPLDSSLIGPELKLGSSPIITDSLEDKTVPLESKESLQNTVNKLESINLPSSLLTTLLKKPVEADSNLNIITQETKLNKELNKLSTDTNFELPLINISQTYKETDFKIVEPILELTSHKDNRNIPLVTKDSRNLKHKYDPSDTTHGVDYGSILDHSLTGTSILYKLENPEIFTSVDSSIHLDSSLVGPSILQEINSRAPTTINQNKQPSEISTAIDSLIKLESSFKGPTLHHEINSKETSSAFESVTQFENSLVPSLHETKESSATASVLNPSQLDSSLIGPNLHWGKAYDSKDILDGSLVGPHLLIAVPFSGEEIQMINEELQSKLDLVNLIPLDSSLIGPHIDFESEFEQSQISRYQNPELIKTSVSNPGVLETRDFVPSILDEEMTPLEPIIIPSLCTPDHQELLSKFTNAVTKPQLSLSELKPCDKLLSSIAKIATDNYVLQSGKDLQTLTLNTLLNTPLSLQDELASEFSPITMTSPTQDFLPVESIKCLDSNNARTPKMLAELLPYAQGVPHIPPTPYSPFFQIKPLIDRNWLGLNNIQNILQSSPSFRPVVGNAPIPIISNISNALPITSEYLKSILDLPSYSKLNPQLSIPDTPGHAIALASECTKPTINLPLNEYIPLLSNLESTVSKLEYKPIVVDNIMSVLDENSLQLLKDMSILPFRESLLLPTTPIFENGEIVSSSLLETVPILDSGFIQTRPLLPIPISNPLLPSSTNNPQIRLHNPQNVPFMIHAPNSSPCSLQPYPNLPLHSEYSEIIGPAPKIASFPTAYPKAILQELLSKPCVESPIILPSSSLDTMLQLPTASYECASGPCQLPPEYFTPLPPIYTNPLTNAFTSPILPIYASPLSLCYAQSSPTPSTSLALNVPYRDSPLRPVPLPINPYIDRQLTPKYSSPVLSDYPQPSTVAHNIPIPLEISNMPSQTYSSPYLPGYPSTIPIDTSAVLPIIRSKLSPGMTSLISPPLSTPYISPLPKSLTSLGSPAYSSPLAPIALGTLAPTPTGPLVPSYLGPTNSYPSLPGPINAQTRPSNRLTPAYRTPISPVTSSLSSYNTPITLNPISSRNPQIKPESQTLRLLNTLPIINTVNPFLNIKQRLPNNPNILPIQSYAIHVPTSNYNTQIKQSIPCEDALESNLLITALTEELPMYDVIEDNVSTYSNDIDDKCYEDPTLKYPLKSLSYTLAPEEITEYFPNEDYIKLEDLSPAPVNNRASEPSLQRTLHPHHRFAPYTPLHSKPVLKPRPAPQILQPPSLIETIPQNIYDNTLLVPSSSPIEHAVSLPTSMLSSPLLKPLSPLTIAPIGTPLIPYNNLPLNEKLKFLSSFPFYSTPSLDMSSPPIYPTELRNIITPQVIPSFSQVPTNAAFVTVSSPMSLPTSQLTTTPYILDNYKQLQSTHYEPRLKRIKSPGSLIKSSPTPAYTQFDAPIISDVSPLEMPQHISSPLSASESLKKAKPFISPQFISSILLTQATLQDSLPLNKAPIHYQPYIEQPTVLTSSANNVFRSPPVTSPYTVLPSVNMVEPDLNRPQSSSFTPQDMSQSSPLSISKYSPTVPHSNIPYSRSSPHIPKKPLTNNIIPSSLFLSSDTDFQPTKNRVAPLYNIPRYSSPTPFSSEPLHTVSLTPSRPLDTTANPKNILKSIAPISNVQYTVPLPSSLQPLQPVDCYQTQPHNNVQYAAKTNLKSSPLQTQYASLSLPPMYTSLPLETAPKQLITKPSTPQYGISSAPVYDSQIHSLPLGRNPFLNPDSKPITEVPSYPVPKNIITSSILAPSESILLSNLRHINISPESQHSYSAPITYSTPFIPSSLLKTSAKRLPQNSGQYRPHIYSNSQYVSQSPMNNTPLQKTSLLQPLLPNSQNNAPLVPMHFSNSNTGFPEGFPIESVPSVTSPGIALSNYLTYDSSDHKHSGPCVSEISKLEPPINPSTTIPYILSKPPFDKHFKSPVSTQTNMPLYSIDDILELSPEILTKANIINTVMPIEVSEISAPQSSPLSLDSLDTETVEEIESNEIIADLKDRLSLKLGFDKQGQSDPAYASKYLATPQPTITMPSTKYKTTMPRPSFSIPSLTSEETELTYMKDHIALSQIKSEPLIEDYSPSERKVPNTPSNIQEPDIVQLSPYNSLLNSEFPPTTYKQLPPNIQTPRYINQIQQPSPVYLSPQEYKDLIQGLSTSQPPSTQIPQLTPSPVTGGLSPQIPLYTSFMSKNPENWLESPIFVKSLPLKEKFLKVTPEKEYIPPLHNKYRIANKMTPQGNKYAEPKSTISEITSELDSINPLLNSKEPYTEYIDDLKSNKENYYDPESDNVSFDESKPDVFEAKPTKNLPEVSKGLSIPNYIRMAQRPRKLSKLDHFYANNHIGKDPQVFNVPTSPIDFPADAASPYTITSPGVLKDSTVIPTKHFASIPKLDTASPSPSESFTERADSPENVPITKSYPQYYLNPYLKYSSQTKSPPNTIEIADTSEIIPTSYNIDDFKYSGYKTYHIPSFKSPLSLQNLGASTRLYSPSLVPYSPPSPTEKPSNIQEPPSLLYSNLYSPPVIYEPPIPQYQTAIKIKTPLQTKLGLEHLQKSPGLNEYNPEQDIPTKVDSIHEDNELKTSLINYINKREDFINNNAEVTIPIGNIAITRKEPYNANTVETNNPSIALKVWKSNVKIAQAELKLKFKDLSVNNFMPIVNNLDKYDMEEIRKIVKNYIDEKYGNHIEINEPYTINNKYTVIKDFDPNGVDSKYNLLWPTNYI